jgi:hypothetical protein
MKSELEKYALERLGVLRSSIRGRDRGVVIGAALSFTPIFPACFLGFVVSCVNLMLLKKNKISRRESLLVKSSFVVGGLVSVLWLYVLFVVGASISQMFGTFYEAISMILNSIFDGLTSEEVPSWKSV